MAVFYKKVEADKLFLSPEQVEELNSGKRFEFLNTVVKKGGGPHYFALLQSGETQVKVHAGQWVIRHPEGHYEVLWDHEFTSRFVAASGETVEIKQEPFQIKAYNQPTAIV